MPPVLSLGMVFFFWGFRATDKGLNIVVFPFGLGSSAGFWRDSASSLRGTLWIVSWSAPAACVSLPCTVSSSSSPAVSALGTDSLLKPGAAPVLRLTPLPSPALFTPVTKGPPFVAAARFGAGRRALKPLSPPEPTLARFKGRSGSSGSSALEGSGRLTRILCGFERSTTF